MAISYDPIARYGQEQYILAGLWAMRYNAQTSAYVGSPYAVSQPSKYMIDPQFASADGKVLGATTGKATMLQHANVSIATRGADDNLDALITGTDLIRSSADDEREWSMNAGELLFPIGLVGIGRTIDGGYCRMVVPQFVADNLGSTPGSGTDPELPEREISGMGLAWVNPLDTTERRPCRRRGFADDVGNYAAPTDPGTFMAEMQALSTTVVRPTAVAGLSITAGTDRLMVAWTANAASQAVTYYILEYKASTATRWLQLAVVDNATTRITGLTTAQVYNVRVSAVNAQGQGPLSAVANGTPT